MATNGATFMDPAASATIPSGFLGALLAGFAAGYLMLCVEKLCDKLPRALEGIKPVLIYPLAGISIVGVMMCAVNPIMGMINSGMNDGLMWLSERPVSYTHLDVYKRQIRTKLNIVHRTIITKIIPLPICPGGNSLF